jgi:hypothetical protein
MHHLSAPSLCTFSLCWQVSSFIIDAEVVAFDREKNAILPFQVLSTRKRKVDVAEGENADDNTKVKVALEVFDLLMVNGKTLLRESLRARRAILRKSFATEVGVFYFASGEDHVENGDTAVIEAYLHEVRESTLHFTAPHRVALHCIAPRRTPHCVELYCIELNLIALHRIASHLVALHIASYRIASHRIALHCIVSHRIALRCIAHRIAHRIGSLICLCLFLFFVLF